MFWSYAAIARAVCSSTPSFRDDAVTGCFSRPVPEMAISSLIYDGLDLLSKTPGTCN